MMRKTFLNTKKSWFLAFLIPILFASLSAGCTQVSGKFPVEPAAGKTGTAGGETPAVILETSAPQATLTAALSPTLVIPTLFPPTLVPPSTNPHTPSNHQPGLFSSGGCCPVRPGYDHHQHLSTP